MGANVYDDTLENLDQQPTAAGTPAPAPDPYDETIRLEEQSRQTDLRKAVIQTPDVPPDRAAEAERLSQRTGIPTPVVLRNFDDIKKRATIADTPYTQMLRETPALAAFVADPQQPHQAPLVKDDMEQLGFLEWLLKAPTRAYKQGQASVDFANLRTQSVFRDLSADEHTQLEAARQAMQDGGKLGASQSWFRGAITGAAQQLPMLFGAFLQGAKSGIPAGVTAGTAAALYDWAAGGPIGEAVGTPLAFAGGVTAGMTTGQAQYMFNLETGNAYEEFSNFRDEVGRPLDPEVAKAAALGTGLINSTLQTVGAAFLLKSIPGVGKLTSPLASSMVKQALRVPTIRAALMEAVKSYGETLTAETATQVAKRAATIIGGEAAKLAGAAKVPGMVAPGNIDLTAQPRVTNPDGTVSTVDSVSVNLEGKEILLSKVTPEGVHLKTPEEALAEYQRTGKNLGTFDTPEAATAFAKQLHEDYAAGRLEPGSQRPATPSSVAEQLLRTAGDSLQSFALTVLPGPLARSLGEAAKVGRAADNVQFFKALGEGVAQSKTVERAPDAAQRFLAQATKDGPVPDVYAPVDTWAQYWQSKDVDPREIATAVTGDPQAYDRAIRTGVDLKIPTAAYAVKLAGTEHNAFFARELRLAPDEMNARESEAFKAEAKRQPAETPAPSNLEHITAAVTDQLVNAGYPRETAAQYAALYEQGFGAIGENAQIDPVALYQRYGLNVDREGLKPAAEPATLPGSGEQTSAGAPASGLDVSNRPAKPRTSASGGVGSTSSESAGPTARGTEAIPAAYLPHFNRAAEDAIRGGFTGTHDQLATAYAEHLTNAQIVARDLAGLERDTSYRDLLTAVAAAGGVGLNAEGTDTIAGGRTLAGGMKGEVRSLLEAFDAQYAKGRKLKGGGTGKSSARQVGDVAGIRGIVKKEGGQPLDTVLEALHEGGRFQNIESVPDLLVHLEDAIHRARADESGATAPAESVRGVLEGLYDVKPGARWWETRTPTDAGTTTVPNASGESAASLEALSRQQSMKTRGEEYVVYDRAGQRRPLIGPDAVDYVPAKGETYGIEGPEGFRLLEDNGGNAPHVPTANLLDPSTFDETSIEHGAGPTSFDLGNIELYQDLFDKYADPDTPVDRLVTGELQPRLPGAEGVRDQEVKQPEIAELPFSLTPPKVKPAPAHEGQTKLFQRGPLTQDDVDAFAAEVKRNAGADLRDFDLHVARGTGDISLSAITVARGAQRAGLGSSVMEALTRFADAHNARIVLYVADRGYTGGTTSRSRLVNFYKRFGFVENAGRHVDLSLSENMYRDPTMRAKELGQPAQAGTRRGFIRFGPDRQMNISLLERADLTTFLHETGHLYLEVFHDVANEMARIAPEARSETQQRLLADMATIQEWLVDEDHTGAGFSEKQHEQFARGFEAYLMEGRAPSIALRSAFAKFRAWLLGVYQSVKGLRVNLTPEVRGVMDRMLATDRAIADAESDGHVEPKFTTPESAGMGPEEFGLYRQTIADASRTAREQLETRLMAEVQREQTREWKAQQETTREAVAQETYARPEYKALAAMQRGTNPDGSLLEGLSEPLKAKLSRDVIVERYGADRLKRLPRPYIYTADGGMDPDLVADMFGFSSGDELLTAVERAAPMDDVIRQETNRRMIQEHGSILLDGTLHERAKAAVANSDRERVIKAELRAMAALQRTVAPFVDATQKSADEERAYERRYLEAETKLRIAIAEGHKQVEIDKLDQAVRDLKRQARGGPAFIRAAIPPDAVLREVAADRVNGMMLHDLSPEMFWSAARRQSRAATEAAARQDLNAAIVATQQELLNQHLFRAVSDARDDVDARVLKAKALTKPATRARIGKAGGSFLEQIDGILDRYQFAAVDKKSIENRAPIEKWIAAMEGEGLPLDLPEELLNEARRRPFTELSYEEFVGVTDGLQQIVHLAGIAGRLLKIAEKADLDATAKDLATEARVNWAKRGRTPPVVSRDRTEGQLGRKLDQFVAAHVRLADFVRELDGGKDGGPWATAFSFPLNEAGADEQDRQEASAKKVAGLLEAAYPRSQKQQLFVKAKIDAVDRSMSKMERLVLALNWGNDGNRQRIRSYEHWTDEQVNAVLNTLDARDMTLVQGLLDHVNSYKSEIVAKQIRVYGVAPVMVEASPIHTRVGDFAGGYYPLKYDDRLSAGADRNLEAGAMAKLAAYTNATTARGHLKERLTSVTEPVRLDFGPLFEHLNQVIHDLSHHETLIDVGRLLNHRDARQAVYDTLGDVAYKEMKAAIRDIAIGVMPPKNGVEAALGYLRSGAAIALVGYKMTVPILHLSGALPKAIVRVGPTWVTRGLVRWARGPEEMASTAEWINATSRMMADRRATWNRDLPSLRSDFGVSTGRFSGWVAEAVHALSLGTVEKQQLVDGYFYLVGKSQQVADMFAFMGQYEKSRAAHETPERATRIAEQAVLDAFGGGQVKDLPSVMRGGPYLKMWTTLYSPFNSTLNLLRNSARMARLSAPASVGRLMADFVMATTVPAALAGAIRGHFSECGDDAKCLAGEFAKAQLSYLANLFVGVREVAGVIEGYKGYEGPSGAAVFSELGKAVQQGVKSTTKLVEGKPEEALDSAFWLALDDVGGILFHYPAGQIRKTVNGIEALSEGRTTNPTAVLFGGPPKNEKR